MKEALGHSITSEVKKVAATCESGGYTVYKCVRCNVTENRDNKPATGHSYGNWGNNTATCIAGGAETRTCSGCGKTDSRDTAALGHSYGSWTTTENATCQHGEKREHTCTRCSYTEWTYEGKTVNHSYENGKCKWCGKDQPGKGNDGDDDHKYNGWGDWPW